MRVVGSTITSDYKKGLISKSNRENVAFTSSVKEKFRNTEFDYPKDNSKTLKENNSGGNFISLLKTFVNSCINFIKTFIFGDSVKTDDKNKVVEQKNKEEVNSNNSKQQELKNITGKNIKDILKTPQVTRSDCYLVASLKALAKSGFGKKMLKNSIKTTKDGDFFEVQFKKYDKDNTYTITNDADYQKVTSRNQFNPTGAVETATSQLIEDKFEAKPALIRAYNSICYNRDPVEYNLASVYMENLTGKKPISIGDNGLLPLSCNKEETIKLLDKIGDETIDKHSFVAGSNFLNTKDGIDENHYYVVKKVDKDNKEVHLINPRYIDFSEKNAEDNFEKDLKMKGVSDKKIKEKKDKVKNMPNLYKLSYDKFMKNFRSVVGYFDEKIKNKKHSK